MQTAIYLVGNDLYISKRYLKSNGYATPKTMEFWGADMGVIRIVEQGETFFLYKSIPLRTRKKLPAPNKIIIQESSSQLHKKVKDLLHDAFYFKYNSYKAQYQNEPMFTTEQITKFSKLHAVWQSIIDLKENETFHNLKLLHEVFNEFFPNKYKTKEAFSRQH